MKGTRVLKWKKLAFSYLLGDGHWRDNPFKLKWLLVCFRYCFLFKSLKSICSGIPISPILYNEDHLLRCTQYPVCVSVGSVHGITNNQAKHLLITHSVHLLTFFKKKLRYLNSFLLWEMKGICIRISMLYICLTEFRTWCIFMFCFLLSWVNTCYYLAKMRERKR